jgi:hypothetical protein
MLISLDFYQGEGGEAGEGGGCGGGALGRELDGQRWPVLGPEVEEQEWQTVSIRLLNQTY